MKKTKSFMKYPFLFLADMAFLIAFLFVLFSYKDEKITWLFSYSDMFVLFGVPLYLLLRAILSRVFLKNPWWPNLMLLVEISPGLPLLSGEIFKGDWKFVLGSLAVAAIIALISMVISLLTGMVMRLIHLKTNN